MTNSVKIKNGTNLTAIFEYCNESNKNKKEIGPGKTLNIEIKDSGVNQINNLNFNLSLIVKGEVKSVLKSYLPIQQNGEILDCFVFDVIREGNTKILRFYESNKKMLFMIQKDLVTGGLKEDFNFDDIKTFGKDLANINVTTNVLIFVLFVFVSLFVFSLYKYFTVKSKIWLMVGFVSLAICLSAMYLAYSSVKNVTDEIVNKAEEMIDGGIKPVVMKVEDVKSLL